MEEIQETTTAEIPDAEAQGGRNVGRTIGIVLVVVVILAAIIAAFYGLATHPPFTAVLRDIFIIVLALVTIVIGLFLGILIFQLQSLTALLRDEIKPILESANQTASTVRGTTTFVSDAVVTPMIRVASYTAGVRQTIKMLVGNGRRQRRQKETKQKGVRSNG